VITLVLIGGLASALALAGAGAVAAWRERASADGRVAEAVATLASAMHETMRDLAETLDAAPGADGSPAGRYGRELASSLDFEEVTARLLDSAAGVAGVDAVVVDAAGPGGDRAIAARGMAEEEARSLALSAPGDGNVRALELSYRYRLDDVSDGARLVRSGVILPLRADGGTVGVLGAFTRSPDWRPTEGELERLELLALHAGPALANARRHAEVRSLASVDAVTGIGNRRSFHETLDRETARATRHGRPLAVIVFDLDDFHLVNESLGRSAGDAALAEVAERVVSVVRAADVTFRVGGDEFAAILPESRVAEARLLAARIARAVAARPVGPAGTLSLSAGVAELEPGDRPADLLARAQAALAGAKERGKARTLAADLQARLARQ
jgi:diguanylate cyclase (GGDEF)-like protein